MLEQFLETNIWVLLVVATRIGTMLSLVPGFGAGYVTPRVRLALAMTMSFLILPSVAIYVPALPTSAMSLFMILVGEVIIGAFMATIGMFVISALQTAGTFIAYYSSMANAMIQDPISNQQSSVISGFLSTVALVAIFAANLHHLVLRALVDSFSLFRPGNLIEFGDISETLVNALSSAFTLGFKLSAPLLVVAFVYYLALGILGRLMPTLQVFFFGLPLQVSLQIWVLMICLSGMMMVFLQAFGNAYVPFISP